MDGMVDWEILRLGYAANVGIAAFLAAAAVAVATRLRVPGRGALAAFLALVAANYALDAIAMLVGFLGGSSRPLLNLAYVVGAFDPPLLTVFALAFAGARVSLATRALLFAPSLLLLAHGALVLSRGPAHLTNELDAVMIPILGGHYAFALTVLATAHHRARTPRERDLRAAVVALFALVVLTRFPLFATDLGWLRHSSRFQAWSLLPLEGALAGIFLASAAVFVATAPADARASARRVVGKVALLLAAVASVWLLRFAPGFSEAAYALLYSVRWVVFAGVVTVDAQRERVLGLPVALTRPARGAFLALLAFLAVVEMTALLAGLPGASRAGAFAGAVAFTALLIAGGGGLVRRGLAEEEARVQKRRVYRAHVELGADARRLAALRAELALAPEDAAEEERLARAARDAPAGGLDRPEPGRAFAGRYEVESLLGSGSFGLVYKARDVTTSARVVLKELRPDWRASAEAAARLRREAEVALRVAHPNLARLLAIERAAFGHVLVFEHVPGETLAARLRRGSLPAAHAARVARDLLAALAALHDAGVLHRDVKPENVVLRPDGAAVLLDLGAAGEITAHATVLSGARHPGTPTYMSPEQRAGKPLGPESDLYALALVLREALPTPTPREWGAVLARALDEEPGRRFRDARELAEALPPA